MISAQEARKLSEETAVAANQSALDACDAAIKKAIAESKRECNVYKIGNSTTRVWLLNHLGALGYSAECVYPTDQRDSTYIKLSW